MKLTALAPALLVAALLAHPAAAAAPAESPVLRVLIVETIDVKEYRKELDKLLVLERTVVPEATIRVWKARFAGADVGTLMVAAEVPSLAALAKIDEFGRTSSEYTAIMRRLEALRRVASDSLYDEVLR